MGGLAARSERPAVGTRVGSRGGAMVEQRAHKCVDAPTII